MTPLLTPYEEHLKCEAGFLDHVEAQELERCYSFWYSCWEKLDGSVDMAMASRWPVGWRFTKTILSGEILMFHNLWIIYG